MTLSSRYTQIDLDALERQAERDLWPLSAVALIQRLRKLERVCEAALEVRGRLGEMSDVNLLTTYGLLDTALTALYEK